jgi:hypothetical protein
MTPTLAMQSRGPIAVTEEVRPEVLDKAALTARSGNGFVLFELLPQPSILVCTLGQGARPVAFPLIITDEPVDLLGPMEFETPWAPKGTVHFLAKKMDWPEPEFDY